MVAWRGECHGPRVPRQPDTWTPIGNKPCGSDHKGSTSLYEADQVVEAEAFCPEGIVQVHADHDIE